MKVKKNKKGTFDFKGLTLRQVLYIKEALLNIYIDEDTKDCCVWHDIIIPIEETYDPRPFKLHRENNGDAILVMRLRGKENQQ